MAKITWSKTPTIATLTLPSGNSYYVKDEEVRDWIQVLDPDTQQPVSGAEKRISDLETAVAALSNATHWLGVTTSQISDGSTTNPITIGGDSVTAVSGDIVQRQDTAQEFIFNGTSWQELGTSVGTLKAFAYVDQGEVTVTPSGTNASSSVTFAGGTTDTFVKEYGSPTSDTFVKSYPGASGKLVKTTVPNVTSAGSAGTAASWSATVTGENLTFAWTTNTPTTPATLGTAIAVATGAIANDGTGDTVMTGLGTATTASAVTGLGTATTATAVTGIGTATAAAQTFTGIATKYDVDPKSNS